MDCVFTANVTPVYVGDMMLTFGLLSSYPFDRIKRLYDINVHGAFFTAREAARHMIPQGGGSIVLVSSMSANVSLPSFDTLVKPDKVY